MRAYISGAWREIESGRVRVGGAWKNLTRIRAYVSGAWEDVATFTPPISLGLTPDIIGDIFISPGTYTSPLVTATPVGGVAPYTYSWAYTSGTTGYTIANPTSASTRFTRSFVVDGEYITNFTCTVTDAESEVASAVIQVTVNAISGF
jgi:hypothetical protein